MSRSTLCRILKVCSASVRRSLQGLDYVSAEGAKAFDELAAVIENLGDYGKGLSWAKSQTTAIHTLHLYCTICNMDFYEGNQLLRNY